VATSSVSGGIFGELYYLYMAIALIVGGLVLGWLGYTLVKFRARPGQPRPRDAPKAGVLPAERGHPIWSYVMAIVIAGIMFGLAFGTISAVHTLEEAPHDVERVEAVVTGFQFGFRLTYPGEGGVPIAKVTDWTIPVETPIVADVVSADVWHNFAIPEFRIRIDVVPGQTNHIWWQAHETGEVYPVCVQLCGTGHALMHTNMKVVSKDEWRAYVAEESAKAYATLEKSGQLVNVTFDGAEFTIAPSEKFNATKAFAIRVVSPESVAMSLSGQHPTAIRSTSAPAEAELFYFPSGRVHLEARGIVASVGEDPVAKPTTAGEH